MLRVSTILLPLSILCYFVVDFSSCIPQPQQPPPPDEKVPVYTPESIYINANRNSSDCQCKQKIRASYITTNVCGRAALCYWELWNYRMYKAMALGHEEYIKLYTVCDEYRTRKTACAVGYPEPYTPKPFCAIMKQECDQGLAQELYEDCEPLREREGYPKPQDLNMNLNVMELNYDMVLTLEDETIFKPLPNSDRPLVNNYYPMSCPMVHRHPHFTIALLLKSLNPEIEYDETKAIEGVAHLLPMFVRIGIDQDRRMNFAALELKESLINWCDIPRNYVCIREEYDTFNRVCDEEEISKLETACGGATRAAEAAASKS